MRDRAFIAAVASVGVLAILIILQNIRESTAPLYGPPTVDKGVVMSKVESGALSFKEASYYVRESKASQDKAQEEAQRESEAGAEPATPGEAGPATGAAPGAGGADDHRQGRAEGQAP